jgi:hypothetical protein
MGNSFCTGIDLNNVVTPNQATIDGKPRSLSDDQTENENSASGTSASERKKRKRKRNRSNKKQKDKKHKDKIPKILRMNVWDKYIGRTKGVAKCYCCKKNEISQLDFQCGHVVAESKGGATNETNLRPICGTCNLSMATMDMNEFIKKYDLNKN